MIRLRRKIFSFHRRFIIAVAAGVPLCCCVIFFLRAVFLLPALPKGDYGTVVLDDNGRILSIFLNRDEQWQFPPGSDPVPDKLKQCVLLFEDRFFYYHPGINPVSVVKAAYANLKSGRVQGGASTLTMQAARLAAPKARTFANKLTEACQAVWLELRYPKDILLRFYLDQAPYGRNIRGITAASLLYFGKKPDSLSWAQAALLAVLPNAPGLMAPGVETEQLLKKRNRLLKRLVLHGVIDNQAYLLALDEPIPGSVHLPPYQAPHFCFRLNGNDAFRGQVVHSTINSNIQSLTDTLVKRHAVYLKERHIFNVSVLVADTRTGEIKAWVGSQDFFDNEQGGQVDGVMAPRSSGSVFKPFLYALAMDQGLIMPQTLLHDIPTYIGNFSPLNADNRFSGLVSAKDSLVQSLNVPSVRLLNSYGTYAFYQFLKQAGVSTLFRPPDDYGLTLVLGGAEVTLADLAMLYRGLGKKGVFEPLRYRRGSPLPASSRALVSPGAALLTLDMLRDVKRPGAEYYWEYFNERRPIAWKTGTSFGGRDAWAVGVSPRWTIAVWAGNFSGDENPELTGSRSAGPLLFDIFNSLPLDGLPENWFIAGPGDLKSVPICTLSGFAAAESCPQTETVQAPNHNKVIRLCPYHQRVFVSADSRYEVCSLCWSGIEYREQTLAVFPPEVASHLRKRGLFVMTAPPHRPECPAKQDADLVSIVYPAPDAHIFLPRDFNGDIQAIRLQASHRHGGSTLFWYLDNDYIGQTLFRHEVAVSPPPGRHQVVVVDESGYSSAVTFFISRYASDD